MDKYQALDRELEKLTVELSRQEEDYRINAKYHKNHQYDEGATNQKFHTKYAEKYVSSADTIWSILKKIDKLRNKNREESDDDE